MAGLPHLARNPLLYRNLNHFISCHPKRCCAHASQVKKKTISIPDRIERGPTDILRALASTVKKDVTAPHYKYMDDPFLIPQSNLNRRAYALSRESGRKAAKFFMDNYPQYFFRDDAEPKVPAFSYKDSFGPETTVSESDLVACISCGEVQNAIQVFRNCRKQKVKLSDEVIESLLQFLCFHNSQDMPDPDFAEERWFKSRDAGSDKKKKWIDDSVAEEVFHSMAVKTPEAVNAMICGYSRHNASEKALQLFEAAKSNNVKLETEAYNHIIKMVTFAKGSGDGRWEMILDILRDMRNTGTCPDVGTFNEILSVLSRQQTWRHAKNMALKITAEMKRLRIEPSLATFDHMIKIHTYDKTGNAAPEILYSIIDYLSGRQLQIRDPHDVLFFMRAMIVCNENLSDVDLAYKVHELLCIGENNKLIGDSYKESVYYQNFVKLMATSESMEQLMEFYEKYVPNTYIPEPDVMKAIIEAAAFHESYKTIPTLWSDCVSFEYAIRDQIMSAFVTAILNANTSDESIRDSFVTVIDDLISRFDTHLKESRAATASGKS
jgi:pentatricopeptide repeat domain-containing protein 3